LKNKTYFVSVIICALTLLCGYGILLFFGSSHTQPKQSQTVVIKPPPDQPTEPQPNAQQESAPTPSVETPPPVPTYILLDVPFTPQAPDAHWDPLHEEACEEASLIQVVAYFRKWDLTKERAEKEIQDLTAWEKEHGYSDDITAQELADIARTKFDLLASVSSDVTTQSIKQALIDGKHVILPLHGQDIGNPYYKQPGPLYHMLTIVGFDNNEVITNDVGTKRGNNYRYSFSTLIGAVHDWTGNKDTVREGKKVMVVISQ